MSASEEVARRLSVIQLAERLGSVAEACRRHAMSRTQFYVYKRRFLTNGLDGLKDLPPVHKTHPQTTPPAVADKILALSLEFPLWGCARLGNLLKRQGIPVSSPTVQKILVANNLGIRCQRLFNLEEKALHEGLVLNREQVKAIERANPCFKERCAESSRPGELLCQDIIYVGLFRKIGKVYLQAVIDSYDSYAFALLHTGKHPEHAAAMIQNLVMPQFEEWGLTVSAILTDCSREYSGQASHPYESCLVLNDIEHRTTRAKHPQTNGFVERFRHIFHAEVLHQRLLQKDCSSIEALQEKLNAWLSYYNEERPHRGYRNMGHCPNHILMVYLESGRR